MENCYISYLKLQLFVGNFIKPWPQSSKLSISIILGKNISLLFWLVIIQQTWGLGISMFCEWIASICRTSAAAITFQTETVQPGRWWSLMSWIANTEEILRSICFMIPADEGASVKQNHILVETLYCSVHSLVTV